LTDGDIAMFPQDYQTMSFEGFVMMFGGGQKSGIDLFAAERIPINSGRTFAMG
jgi:hypothetical protein